MDTKRLDRDEYSINPAERIKIHSSHIKTFLMCPAKFFFQYVKRVKAPPSSALVLGKSLHYAAETNMVQKKETRTDLQLPEVLGAFEEAWDDQKANISWEPGEDRGGTLDTGIACTKSLAIKVMPPIQPKEVELSMEAPITNRDFDITGRIDCQDQRNYIRDFKTTGAYLSKDENGKYKPMPADIIQITQYSLMARSAKIQVDGTQLDYIHKKIPKSGDLPKVMDARHKVTPDNENAFLRIADKIIDAVKRGAYVPNPCCFICSPVKCGYYNLCRAGAIF